MKILDRETTFQLLYRFVNHDNTRMNKPFIQELELGNNLCATDGSMVVLVPVRLIPETQENEIENNDEYFKPVDINRIVPKVFTENIEVDFNNILKLYSDVKVVSQEVVHECESCDGDKKFEHFGHWYECENCNRTGITKTGRFENVKYPDSIFVFKEHNMSIKYVEKLIYIYKSIQPEKCTIIELTPHLIWFDMDGVRVAIAGLVPDKNDSKLIFINAIN